MNMKYLFTIIALSFALFSNGQVIKVGSNSTSNSDSSVYATQYDLTTVSGVSSAVVSDSVRAAVIESSNNIADSIAGLLDTIQLDDVLDGLYRDSLNTLPYYPQSGNVYLDSTDNRIHYLSHGYWYRVAVQDSSVAKPSILVDGNTVGWYIASDLSTITKTVNGTTKWEDQLKSGHDLIAPLGEFAGPVQSGDSLTWDGSNDFMEVQFTLAQPEEIYMVIKQVTHVDGAYIIDGYTPATGLLKQLNPSPNTAIYAGTGLSASNTNLTLGSWHIVRILFNGASSEFQVNATTAITGNYGVASMDGIRVGAYSADVQLSNIKIKEIIVRKVADSAGNKTIIYNYLKDKYGL